MKRHSVTPIASRLRLKIAFGTLIAAALAVGYVYSRSRGGLAEMFELPAVLDDSTPAEQGGSRLLGILRASTKEPSPIFAYDGEGLTASSSPIGSTHLWIQIPETRSRDAFKGIRVSGKASNGAEGELPWQAGDLGRRIVEVVIPPGYPDDVRWMDITLRSPESDAPTWRISRLPKAHRFVTGPAKETLDIDGLKVSGSAQVTHEPKTAVLIDLNLAGKPGGLYSVKIDGMQFEWAASSDLASSQEFMYPDRSRNHFPVLADFAMANQNHWVRVPFTLTTYRIDTKRVRVTAAVLLPLWFKMGNGKESFNVFVETPPVRLGERGTLSVSVSPVPPPKDPSVLPRSYQIGAMGFEMEPGATPLPAVVPIWKARVIHPTLPDKAMAAIRAAFASHAKAKIPLGDFDVEVMHTVVASRRTYELTLPLRPLSE